MVKIIFAYKGINKRFNKKIEIPEIYNKNVKMGVYGCK